MKKLISLLLVFVLVFSSLSVLALADTLTLYCDGDFEYYIEENEAYIIKVLAVDEDGLVAIPSLVSKSESNKINSSLAAARDISVDDNETDDPYANLVRVVSIKEGAFNSVYSLVKTVSIPPYVREIEEKALKVPNLESIVVSEQNTSYCSLNGSLYNYDKDLFIFHPMASADSLIASTVTTIQPGAFEDSKNITSVTIPAGVTAIPDFCFNNCYELSVVNFSSSNIASIGEYAFSSTALESVQFSSAISFIDAWAFYESANLEELIIPESATEVTIGDAAFIGCPILGLTLYRNVTSIGDHAFGFYYDDMYLSEYPLIITGYKYSPDKTSTTNTFAYADSYEFEFRPLDPIYSVKVQSINNSIKNYHGQMFLYKGKTLKYTTESNNGVYVFNNVEVDEYSIYVLTEFGVLVNLNKKASVTEGYIETFTTTTTKYSPTGDLNRDGIIDMSDISLLLGGNYSSSNPAYDINKDGIVDVKDISIVLDKYNYAAEASKIVADYSTPTIPIP